MPLYFEVLTDLPINAIGELKHELDRRQRQPNGMEEAPGPRCGWQFHTPADADAAQAAFERQFQRRELPADIPEFPLDTAMNIVDLMVATGLAASKGEAPADRWRRGAHRGCEG